MKNKLMLSLAVSCAASSAFGYDFLFTAHSNGGLVAIGNDRGEILWSTPASHPQNADISPDGKRVFFSTIGGATMMDMTSKKVLWRYECPTIEWDGVETKKLKKGDKVKLQNPVAQILPDGRFLVGNEGKSRLLEIDAGGSVLKEIRGETLNRVNHGEFRLATKTADGKYIFPMLSSSLLTVYDSQGNQLVRIKTPQGVVSASFLENGDILCGGIFGIAIYSTDGKQKWSFTSKELAAALGLKAPVVICDTKLMPNGNILCTTYGDNSIPDVLEVSKDKKIIKVIDFPNIAYFSAIKLIPPTADAGK